MANPSSSKGKIKDTVPKLVDFIDTTIYGDIWQRPELSKRDRSLITVSALIAMRATDQMKSHMEKALDNGVTPEELTELITHLAFYEGTSAAVSAALIARPVLVDAGFVKPDSASN